MGITRIYYSFELLNVVLIRPINFIFSCSCVLYVSNAYGVVMRIKRTATEKRNLIKCQSQYSAHLAFGPSNLMFYTEH